jgi:hypothetical protein
MTPLVQEAVRLAPHPETAMWFDVGTMEPLAESTRTPVDVLLHLPFKRTGIAGIDSKGRKFSLWMTGGEQSVTTAGCTMEPVSYFAPFAYIRTDDGLRYYNNDKEVTRQQIDPVLRMVCAVLNKLSSGGTAYKATPKQTFINRKRAAKGKSAISFDWHTVEIGPKSIKGEAQGGTHASPRLHDRRGHWRTYPSVKKGWVKACKVGDASKGVVFKDYEVKHD